MFGISLCVFNGLEKSLSFWRGFAPLMHAEDPLLKHVEQGSSLPTSSSFPANFQMVEDEKKKTDNIPDA